MAFTEKYVTVAGAGAHDGTSEANAWTFAEMITAAPAAGTRVNVKAGTYSVGAYVMGTGTIAAPFVVRGYNSTIGDLDNQGRNADGTLNTTSMPAVTITTAWTPGAYSILQNLNATAALSGAMVTSASVDKWGVINCSFTNSLNSASARTVSMDDNCFMINCDFDCTGAAHSYVANMDVNSLVAGCRFKGTSSAELLNIRGGTVQSSAFIGNGSNIGIKPPSVADPFSVSGCTFYNLTACIQMPNAVNTGWLITYNNHATDCGKWIDNLYSATANIIATEICNRTRDVTTLLTGIESVEMGAVTTDTGGASTDYTNAGSDNLTLISTAPGKGAGMPAYTDIGAYQRQETGGGGGGLMITNPMRGGVI